MKSITLYNSLIEKLNYYEMKLLQRHGESINCKKGCDYCCMLESVFPIEAYIIYSSPIDMNIICESYTSNEKEETCVFLKDKICTIYSARPVICRTHGYPVFVEGRADMCPENFKDIKSIDSEYILDLENVNNAIASINIIFQKEIDEEFFTAPRIPLKELKDFMLKR
ncbi:MAG: YkgJ family cysteine cluster protein [Spirochaetes bacterium]|nr:YkgJ family cysteine cluster protein [Spirochaetota bacterium]